MDRLAIPVTAGLDAFEQVPPPENAYSKRPRLKAREGASSQDLQLGSLGYARAASESYHVFRELKRAGAVPEHLRFQVGLPAPLEPVIGMFTPESQEIIYPAYEEQLNAELDAVLDAVPLDELAIQWEIVYQVGVLEGMWSVFFFEPERAIPERAALLVDRVPETVEAGFHLCYGDSGHQHFKQPENMRVMVDLTNGIVAAAKRPVGWFHMPVPIGRHDDAYFEALGDLKLSKDTDLYLGLVHHTDGEAGTQDRIETARRHVAEFGVATECGMGRRPAQTIPELLRIHAAVSNPL